MTELKLKTFLAISIIIFHFFIILLIILLWLFGGFLFEEMTTSIALIIPIFGAYITAIIKWIIDNKNLITRTSVKVNGLYLFLAFFLYFLYILLIIGAIMLKAFNIGFTDFEQFKIMLGLLQTVFGAYTGLVLSDLFPIEARQKTRP